MVPREMTLWNGQENRHVWKQKNTSRKKRITVFPSIFIQIEKFLMARNAASMEDIFSCSPSITSLISIKFAEKYEQDHNYKYDLNAILSDLIYTRILDPGSKRSSFQAAKKFLEPPRYELHDSYRALSILAQESTFIQSEVYKNSCEIIKRNQGILYYDCTNYYFEIEQEEDDKQYGKSKENRPNPIIQMGLFTDGDGIPLAFSLFPGNQNEQKSLSPLEKK